MGPKDDVFLPIDISRDPEGTTIQTSGGVISARCFVGCLGTGNNSDAVFELSFSDVGQVEGGTIKMCGPLERSELKSMLKQVLHEMDLIEMRDTLPF